MLSPAADPRPPLLEAELPFELRESVQRHCGHLATLVASFRAAGIDESVIENGVRQLTDSYGNELTAAIHALVQDQSHAA